MLDMEIIWEQKLSPDTLKEAMWMLSYVFEMDPNECLAALEELYMIGFWCTKGITVMIRVEDEIPYILFDYDWRCCHN